MEPYSRIQYINCIDISLKLNVFLFRNNATPGISDVPMACS